MEKSPKIIIGRKDVADFEELKLFGVVVKIDSGAYTSSFHCHQIRKTEINGKEAVRCNLLDPGHEQYHEKEFVFTEFKIRNVKSSNGLVEQRFSVFTEITLFNRKMPIELTLTERPDMKHPVLLGRKFTSRKFLIDTSRKNLSLRRKKIEIIV